MGFSLFTYSARALCLMGAALALSGSAISADADEVQTQQAAGAPYATPASKLQVNGTQTKLSLDAEQVPVQSLLKTVFNQVHSQFTIENGVVGQVTMHLTDQSLGTILDAVCKQLLIRYHVDAHGIYVFEQDTEATKAAIARIQDLDSRLRVQLRALGLSLPEDNVLDGLRNAPAGTSPRGGANGDKGPQGPQGPQGAGGPGRSGGFGGGRASQPPGNLNGGGGPAPDGASADGRVQSAPGLNRRNASIRGSGAPKTDSLAKDNKTEELQLNYLTPDAVAQIFGLNGQNNALQNPDAYRAWAQQNGFVFINTGNQKAPVVEILEELSRQSNTPILIDSSVPHGPKFSLQGYITPRSLPEALSALSQAARLTWRWIGSTVYVTALPDFQIFYNSVTPRVVYGNSALQTQQVQQSQAPAPQSQINNGYNGYLPPTQTPLPITNGEKKTP